MSVVFGILVGKINSNFYFFVVYVLKRKRELNVKFIWGRYKLCRGVNWEGKKVGGGGMCNNVWIEIRSWG